LGIGTGLRINDPLHALKMTGSRMLIALLALMAIFICKQCAIIADLLKKKNWQVFILEGSYELGITPAGFY